MWFVLKHKHFHVDLWQYPRFGLFYKKKIDISFGGHFDSFIESVVSVLFQYSERRHIHYHDNVETWVSNLKFIKSYDIGPEMT